MKFLTGPARAYAEALICRNGNVFSIADTSDKVFDCLDALIDRAADLEDSNGDTVLKIGMALGVKHVYVHCVLMGTDLVPSTVLHIVLGSLIQRCFDIEMHLKLLGTGISLSMDEEVLT